MLATFRATSIMSVHRVTQVLSSPLRLLRMTYECTENAGCHDRRKTARRSTIERTTPALRRSRRRPAVNTSAWIGNDRGPEAARIAPCVLRIRIRGRTVGKLQACIHLAACCSEVALACGGELELYSYKNASGGAPLPPLPANLRNRRILSSNASASLQRSAARAQLGNVLRIA